MATPAVVYLSVMVLVALAAFFNAVMDRIETLISFNVSIFCNLDPRFWCKPVSAHHAKFIPFTKYRLDAWHLAKSGMVIALCSAIALAAGSGFMLQMPVVGGIVLVIACGCVWNFVFEMCYSGLLKK
jgi:hypothetical protein